MFPMVMVLQHIVGPDLFYHSVLRNEGTLIFSQGRGRVRSNNDVYMMSAACRHVPVRGVRCAVCGVR